MSEEHSTAPASQSQEGTCGIRNPAAYVARSVKSGLAKDPRKGLWTSALKLAGKAKEGLLDWAFAKEEFTAVALAAGVKRREVERTVERAYAEAKTGDEFQTGPYDIPSPACPNTSRGYVIGAGLPDRLPIERILARIPVVGVPDVITGGGRWDRETEPLARLLAAAQIEAAERGDPDFYFSQDDLVKHAGLSGRSALKRQLARLHRLKLLSRTRPGVPVAGSKVAAYYRWHFEPDPAGVVWAESDKAYEEAEVRMLVLRCTELGADLEADLEANPALSLVYRAMMAIHEARNVGDGEPFGASFAAIARLADLDVEVAARWIGVLNRMGYVERATVGTSGEAGPTEPSTWILHDPPIEGGAPWVRNPSVPEPEPEHHWIDWGPPISAAIDGQERDR